MKRFICLYVLVVSTLILTTCQNSEDIPPISSTTIPTTLSKVTETATNQGDNTLIESTATESVIEKFNFVNISGSVFAGSQLSGDYLEIDFSDQALLEHKLPSECQIYSNGVQAICTQNQGLSIYTLTDERAISLQTSKVLAWRLTASNESLYYYSESNGDDTELHTYNIQSSAVQHLGKIDFGDWVIPPFLSNDGTYLIGAKYSDSPKAQWHEIDINSNTNTPLKIPSDSWATYNISWSPNNNIVALGATNVNSEIGSCPNKIIVYNPLDKSLHIIAVAPNENCYDDFEFHRGNIWSPDGSMIALMMNQETLCVISILNDSQKCSPISAAGERIYNLTWSPDSRFLIYLTSESNLLLFSIEDETIVSVGHLPITLGVDDLVWIAPK